MISFVQNDCLLQTERGESCSICSNAWLETEAQPNLRRVRSRLPPAIPRLQDRGPKIRSSRSGLATQLGWAGPCGLYQKTTGSELTQT